jgi:hypothetical protein
MQQKGRDVGVQFSLCARHSLLVRVRQPPLKNGKKQIRHFLLHILPFLLMMTFAYHSSRYKLLKTL